MLVSSCEIVKFDLNFELPDQNECVDGTSQCYPSSTVCANLPGGYTCKVRLSYLTSWGYNPLLTITHPTVVSHRLRVSTRLHSSPTCRTRHRRRERPHDRRFHRGCRLRERQDRHYGMVRHTGAQGWRQLGVD